MGGHGHDDPQSIKKEVNKYLFVFLALAVLTVITVAISYLHLPVWAAVVLALVVATFKAGLVAGFFMHLISERAAVYALLLFTAFFFVSMVVGTAGNPADYLEGTIDLNHELMLADAPHGETHGDAAPADAPHAEKTEQPSEH
jgi:cytochrome c oxidase subunit IV